ncbi:hypothetical protein C8J55DRAFT_502527 [Lentinula edodes]|uniref:Uncharacterized protein n=1 Tax=Lentinula lateritia TaxID=40482 RepID=A0A9W9AW39_9AGAR|nr:hypothetical protein C8J55DRAFT_502527 [Lentinula edodes]
MPFKKRSPSEQCNLFGQASRRDSTRELRCDCSDVSDLAGSDTADDDEHTISAFGDVAASEINFIRCSSPEALELPRQNSSPIIKRPLPPSRRKAYSDLDDFAALCDSLCVVQDHARPSGDHTKLHSQPFEQQVSHVLSESQVPSYSGPSRVTRTLRSQARQIKVLPPVTSHREYDLPRPLRNAELRDRSLPLPSFELYIPGSSWGASF